MASHQRHQISRNPFDNTVIKEHTLITNDELKVKMDEAYRGYLINRKLTLEERVAKIIRVAEILEADRKKYATLITQEMGKPITQSIAEVLKSAKQCRFFAEKAAEYLRPERLDTKESEGEAHVQYDPLGIIFQIVPFNFPFWLAFKGAVTILLSGNSIIHKNAHSTTLVGDAVGEVFRAGGFDNGEFVVVRSASHQTDMVLADPRVRGVEFTGSTGAGQHIASLAGRYMKKCVMELGGADPFLVLGDANPVTAADLAIKCRLPNAGQTCTAAKRFIVQEGIIDTFRDELVAGLKKVRIGDPMNEDTELGPMARENVRKAMEDQLAQAVKEGAKIVYGGKRVEGNGLEKGFFFEPTLIEVESSNNLAMREEIFGPVWTLIKFKTEEEGIRIANDTPYGLGAVIVTKDVERAKREIVGEIEAGCVFVNERVSSDSRFPSGGVKDSGYGRQGGAIGMREFTNIKAVWTKNMK